MSRTTYQRMVASSYQGSKEVVERDYERKLRTASGRVDWQVIDKAVQLLYDWKWQLVKKKRWHFPQFSKDKKLRVKDMQEVNLC